MVATRPLCCYFPFEYWFFFLNSLFSHYITKYLICMFPQRRLECMIINDMSLWCLGYPQWNIILAICVVCFFPQVLIQLFCLLTHTMQLCIHPYKNASMLTSAFRNKRTQKTSACHRGKLIFCVYFLTEKNWKHTQKPSRETQNQWPNTETFLFHTVHSLPDWKAQHMESNTH